MTADSPGVGPRSEARAATEHPPPSDATAGNSRQGILRGLVAMTVTQILQVPLTIAVNGVLARELGPVDFGVIYLASTVVGVAFLFVEWGQNATVSAEVAKAPGRTEMFLGSSLAIKAVFGLAACTTLWAVAPLLGYGPKAQVAVLFLALQSMFACLHVSGTAVLRGKERTDLVSVIGLSGSVLAAALSIGAALAGLGLNGVLWSMVLGTAVQTLPIAWVLLRNGLGLPRFDSATLRVLLSRGAAFLLFGLILALQPYIDAAMLSRYAPPEVMGWHAATRRLSGLLIFPATSLSFTLFPTLSRLAKESVEAHRSLIRAALRVLVLTSVPATIGTALFAGEAVRLVYGGGSFAGAIPNLQVYSLWILLVYFSMLVGSVLMTTDRMVPWTVVQSLCLAVSVIADPPLITYFQQRHANGAVGVSVSSVVSELLMVVLGFRLVPAGLLGGGLLKAFAQALGGGLAMAVVALSLQSHPWVAMPLSGLAYLGVVWFLGAFAGEELSSIFGLIRAKVVKRVEGA